MLRSFHFWFWTFRCLGNANGWSWSSFGLSVFILSCFVFLNNIQRSLRIILCFTCLELWKVDTYHDDDASRRGVGYTRTTYDRCSCNRSTENDVGGISILLLGREYNILDGSRWGSWLFDVRAHPRGWCPISVGFLPSVCCMTRDDARK